MYEYCNFLKEVTDAVSIRKKILDCFEAAAIPGTSDQVRTIDVPNRLRISRDCLILSWSVVVRTV